MPVELSARAAADVENGAGGPVRLWLLAVAFLVLAMIVVGGATRLTDSGLSITEWKPVLGAIPPLSEAHWLEAFAKYKEIPEYQMVNKGMSLAHFKTIYLWEWSHRFLGRFIGLAFAVPLALFWLRGKLPAGFGPKLVGVLALGGLQGAIGWYMVSSGLVDRVDVSHYRLALHLGAAFVILAALIWLAMDAAGAHAAIRLDTVRRQHTAGAGAIVVLLFLQVLLGALVAGTKAGLVYNTWPLMDGRIVPGGLMVIEPWYMNLFENVATIQFDHRMMAYLIAAVVVWHLISLRGGDDDRLIASAVLLAAAVAAQIVLGIWTLLAAEGAMPIGLGLAHQGGAAIVFALAVAHLHRVRHSPARH